MLSTQQKARRRGLALALLSAAQFMVVLDFSIVNIALPSIQRDLGLSTPDLQWIVSAYSLTFGGFLLLGGRMSDLYGRRRLFLIGLVVFSLGSFVGGFAPSGLLLIACRAVQGLGAALVAPTSISLVTTTFAEGPDRNKAFGVIGALASAGFAAGAILGGLLTAGPGWRWVMFVNVPIGIAAIILTPILINESRAQLEDRRLDVFGAVTVTAGLVALVYALTRGNEVGWLTVQTIGLIVLAVALLATFVIIELRSPFPLLRLGIFRVRTVTGANLVTLLAPGVFGSVVFILTLYMQKVLGYSALLTGLAFLPLAGMVLITSNTASRLVARLGVKPFLVGGMIILVVGILLLTGLSPQGTFVGALLPGTLVVALGMGPIFATMVIAATSGVSNDEQGLASGLFNTTLQVGSGLCLAVVTAVSTARAASFGAHGGLFALTDGFRYALYVCAAFAVLGIFSALFGIREHIRRDKTTPTPDVQSAETSGVTHLTR
ncbi:MAG: MFS transporter [Ktedonobacteraceae bacterium]|nr:MFS transporter [Ktedonobacteraceae bacterium]